MRSSARFAVAADTVLDTRTGLMWQRAVPLDRFTWVEATAYAKSLRLGGHTDWRLPTKEELESIVVKGRGAPAIDTVAFPNTPGAFFWSSSPDANTTDYAWGVSFYDGYTFNDYTTNNGRVRCVRRVDQEPQ